MRSVRPISIRSRNGKESRSHYAKHEKTYIRSARMKKRILSLLLAALLLAGSLASCSDGGSNTEETKNAGQETETETNTTTDVSPSDDDTTKELTSAEERQKLPDNLPEKNFNGRDFLVGTTDAKSFEICSEDLVGEATNDAVYDRNLRIADRFGTNIGTVSVSDTANDVKTVVLSGTYSYDVVNLYDFQAYIPISESGALRNWLDFDYVDLKQPWHNALANDAATINGKLFAINSDLSVSTLLYTYGIFFNYSIMERYGYPAATLYDMVFEGSWTLDKMYEITSGIWEDNGDGVHNADDVHGYAVTTSGVNTHDVWLAALDLSVLTKNADGEYEITFFNEKTLSALEKVNQLYHRSEGTFFDSSSTWTDPFSLFANGKVAMTQMYFGTTMAYLGDMEDVYGILPLPKLDEEQEAYYTNAWDQFSVFGVPGTMASDEDTEFIGIIYEALSAESYKYVYPAYYDVALKSRYSAEPTVAEVIDLIMAGRKLDMTFQFGEKLQYLPYTFRYMVIADANDLASRWQKNKKALNKTLKRILELYE